MDTLLETIFPKGFLLDIWSPDDAGQQMTKGVPGGVSLPCRAPVSPPLHEALPHQQLRLTELSDHETP